MPWDGELPHDWTGVAGLVVVGLVIIIAAQGVGGGLILRYHKRNNDAARADRQSAAGDREAIMDETAAIRSQVANGHAEPLRADLDRLAVDVGDLKLDVQHLRDDMRQLVARMAEWSPLIPLVQSFAPEIKALRADLAEERDSRRSLAADVRADMARNRDEVTDLHKRFRDASW